MLKIFIYIVRIYFSYNICVCVKHYILENIGCQLCNILKITSAAKEVEGVEVHHHREAFQALVGAACMYV